MRNVIFGLTFLIFSNFSAEAFVSIELYQDATRKQISSNDPYISGVADGIIVANIEFKNRGGQQIVCPPRKFNMSTDKLHTLINDEIRAPSAVQVWQKSDPIELVILFALKKHFPCN